MIYPYDKSYIRYIRKKIHERDDYRCRYCGLEMKGLYLLWKAGIINRHETMLSVDHVMPKNPFMPYRDWSEKNLVTACKDCNLKKGGWKNLETPEVKAMLELLRQSEY